MGDDEQIEQENNARITHYFLNHLLYLAFADDVLWLARNRRQM